jgi:DinB superfamily
MKDTADLARWAARDFVFNLEAIPADRLDWKPSPEAKSALQLAGEVAGVAGNTLPVLQGGDWTPSPLPQPATLQEARQLVLERADAYAAALEAADPASLRRHLELPFGKFWAERFVLFPLLDLVHHRGQLCYLQSLLGDAEVRFDPEAGDRFFNPPGASAT